MVAYDPADPARSFSAMEEAPTLWLVLAAFVAGGGLFVLLGLTGVVGAVLG